MYNQLSLLSIKNHLMDKLLNLLNINVVMKDQLKLSSTTIVMTFNLNFKIITISKLNCKRISKQIFSVKPENLKPRPTLFFLNLKVTKK